MNVSMYTGYAFRHDLGAPVEALRHFYDKGVRYGDMIDNEFTARPMDVYAGYLTEAGLGLSAVVSMLDIANFDASTREANMANVKAEIDLMHKLGIPRLMPAPSVKDARSLDEFERMRELMIEGFSELVDYAKGSGIHVMIENQSSHVRADSKIADLRVILDAVPGLGFVLDSGNFYCVGEDVLEAYEKLGDRMTHMHCKDWHPDPFGPYVRENLPRINGTAIGDGVLPLRELFARLRADDSQVNVVLEINSSRTNLEMLDRSAEFLCEQTK